MTGAEVIDATRAAGTALVTMDEHASVADPGTDHGLSGSEEEDQAFEGEYDFKRNRSVIRWEFPLFDIGFEEDSAAVDEGPTKVEARAIDDTAYVRDGSWLCPGCGMDDDEPLPSDKWITVPAPEGDKAFDFSFAVFYGRLGWMELVDEPVSPIRTDTIGGVRVGVYETTVPNKDAQAAAGKSEGDEFDDAPQFQGDSVTIRFEIDDQKRLRRLIVTYKMDDRTRTFTATLDNFGQSVEIEKPPENEIFRE